MRVQQLSLLASAAAIAVAQDQPAPEEPDAAFDWSSLKGSETLTYVDCSGGFKCAKLLVPLDLKDESDDRTISIAVMTLPAQVSEDDPAFGGTIFVNPGGPGGAGTSFMPALASHMQGTFDIDGEKHYEILSWDPRGIGYSEPKVDCYPGNKPARNVATAEIRGSGGPGRDDNSLAVNYGLNEGFAKQCKAKDEGIMGYTTTPAVVGDMLLILDQVDALQKKKVEARGIQWRRADEKPRMKYLGFSYGAALGQYLMTMHPERVSRMVLDGVESADEYANKAWINNVVDVDAIFDEFISDCNGAPEGYCPLAKAGESDEELRARVIAGFEALSERPVGALHPLNGAATAITGFDLRQLFGLISYDPIANFPAMSAILANTFAGNYSTIMAVLTQYDQTPSALDDCPSRTPVVVAPPIEGGLTYTCLDGADDRDKDLAYWKQHGEELKETSYIYGDAWQVQRFTCAPWEFKGHWTFRGPFTGPAAANSSTTPSAPMLLLSTRLDPVTPLSFAREVQGNYPGTKLLIQDAAGHAAIAITPSKQRDSLLRKYMAYGDLPEEDETEVKSDCKPFELTCEALEGVAGGAVGKRDVHPTERPLKIREHKLSVY